MVQSVLVSATAPWCRSLYLRTILPTTRCQTQFSRAKLQLNGHDRFSEREGRYFNLVQPYQHHEKFQRLTSTHSVSSLKRPRERGTCNMSRIDSATLHLTLSSKIGASTAAKVRVYATNYNVLRIMSGMGGLAYSN